MQTVVHTSIAAMLFGLSLAVTAPPAVAQQATHVRYQEIRDGAYSVVAQVRAKPGKEDALRAATLPLIALVLIFQLKILAGLTAGAVKG